MPDTALLTRQSIMADARDRLTAAITAVAGRVYGPRLTKIPDEDCPCLLVYVASSDDDNISASYPKFRCKTAIAVECMARGGSDEVVSEQANVLGEAVDAALLQDSEWVRQFERVLSRSYDQFVSSEGNKRMCVVKLVYTVQYVEMNPPDIATADDLLQIVTTIGNVSVVVDLEAP